MSLGDYESWRRKKGSAFDGTRGINRWRCTSITLAAHIAHAMCTGSCIIYAGMPDGKYPQGSRPHRYTIRQADLAQREKFLSPHAALAAERGREAAVAR